MKYLALDLGSRTGWAVHSDDNSITSGTVEFRNNRWEGGGMRFLRFKQWLIEIEKLVGGFDSVAVEEVRRHRGVDAAHCYGGFLAVLSSWCESRKIPYQGVPVGTIKKYATGKGNAGKEAVINAMKAKSYHPADDNEADALALLHLVLDREVTS